MGRHPDRADAAMVLVLPEVAPGTQLLLGRSRASDVRFLEPSVSRRHAALQRVEGGWLLVDRASTHGTAPAGCAPPGGAPRAAMPRCGGWGAAGCSSPAPPRTAPASTGAASSAPSSPTATR